MNDSEHKEVPTSAEVCIITEEDLPRVAEQTGMDPLYTKKVLEMMLKDELVLFAAKMGDTFVGRASLWLAEADEPEVRNTLPGVPLVNALQVNEEARGAQVATKIMKAIEAEVLRRGGDRIALGVEPDNEPARRLYEKLGYAYVPIEGDQTYKSCWDETDEVGAVRQVCVDTLLMGKVLKRTGVEL